MPTTAKKTEEAPAPQLAPAGSSTDPNVHQLLAHLEIAERNDDKDAAKAAVAALADLGVAP